jgi:hypothetical protein
MPARSDADIVTTGAVKIVNGAGDGGSVLRPPDRNKSPSTGFAGGVTAATNTADDPDGGTAPEVNAIVAPGGPLVAVATGASALRLVVEGTRILPAIVGIPATKYPPRSRSTAVIV